MFKYTEKMAFT